MPYLWCEIEIKGEEFTIERYVIPYIHAQAQWNERLNEGVKCFYFLRMSKFVFEIFSWITSTLSYAYNMLK